jgi:nitrite reductase/ring-hydroxylating ferredoxin subunit
MLKYLSPENLYLQIKEFTKGLAVTRGSFELLIEHCTLEDVEWNHMDQLHRPTIHNTYEKNIRVAFGTDFAISLTQWGRWPFFITVSDSYIEKGLFYQSLTLAGVIFLHSIISMEQINDNVKLKDEWFIASHRFFRFIHPFLNKKLYKLNQRLQKEDEQIRQGRFKLRKEGYQFHTDQPNYYNSNILKQNTIYPSLTSNACITLEDISLTPSLRQVGNLKFIVKKEPDQSYFIWPAACPHEGGPLINGSFCESKVTCPWHGLHFRAAHLSVTTPRDEKYGFEYMLSENKIYIKRTNQIHHILHDHVG